MANIVAPLADMLQSVPSGVQMIPMSTTVVASQVAPIDLNQPYQRGQIKTLQAVYVDNWSNDATVIVTAPRTGQAIIAPPYSIGWYPLFVPEIPTLELRMVPTRATITAVAINLVLTNVLLTQGPTFNEQAIDGPTLSHAVIAAVGVGPNTLVAAIANQSIRVHRLYFTALNASRAILYDGSAPLTGDMNFAAGGQLNLPYSEKPYFTLTAGASFDQTGSAALASFQGACDFVQGV